MISPYYKSPNHDFNLICGDTFELLPQFNFKFDMIFADPPYFLSNGGISVQSGKVVCVNKGDWDKGMSQEEINDFNLRWLSLCRDKLKDNGTIWISGTYHNIFSVANSLTQLGYKILNVITWAKTNPPPNISCRYFTYSTEFIIWARKYEKVPHYYNFELMKRINGDSQMTDVWRLPAIAPWEKSCTKHPTQKPLGLLSRIILASTEPGAWILDPFAGSSTTGIAANLLERRFLGIEREENYAAISKARREEIEDAKTFAVYRHKIPDIVKSEDNQLNCFACHESDAVESLPFLEDEIKPETVLMYAIVNRARKKTEEAGKIAIGVDKIDFSTFKIEDITHIMFHYWDNGNAVPHKLTKKPIIVDRDDVPEDYLIRMDKESAKFLLLEYYPDEVSNIGEFDIMQVQQRGIRRYMPFVTTVEALKV